MFFALRTWNLIVLAGVFVFVITYLFYGVRFPIDNIALFEINSSPIAFYGVFRLSVTLHLLFTYLYFCRHCVVAHREESTRIITRG